MGRPIGSQDKVRRKFKNSFARQYLEDHNVQMFKGDEQILTPVNEKLYDIILPNTKYYVGEVFAEEGEIRKITGYHALQDLGFVIVSVRVNSKTRWMTGQKVKYELKRADETGEHNSKMPIDHYVEHDPSNKIARIVGPNAGPNNFGFWVELEKSSMARPNAGRKMNIANATANVDELLDKQFLEWTGQEQKPKPVKIPEAAFLITDANEIVCMPNTPDMPSILITGMKGCQIGTDTVLMADGGFKPIKDIVVGDIVLSPQKDGTTIPSKVLRTTSCFCDEMYAIKELNRQKRTLYTCSYNHQIPLNKHIIPRVKGKKRLDLTYNDIRHNTAGEYSKWSKGYKQKCTTLLAPKIDSFGNKNPSIDPYTLGYFLGDGSYSKGSLNFVMHREDINIYDHLNNKEAIRTTVQEHVSRVFYSINGKFSKQLDKLGLKGKKSGNKFFPEETLNADSEFRLQLLAGYIDSDGHFEKNKGSYDFVSKSETLIRGLNKLVKSLGGRTGRIRPVTKTAQNGFSGKYWRMSAYFGELDIPVKCARKKNTGSKMYLSANRVSIDAVPAKPATVYGFTLDSPSSWYITNDYVVTHNSGKCLVQDENTDFVLDGLGRLKKISEKPKSIVVLNKKLKLETAPVKEYFKREVNEVISMSTKHSRHIKLTPEHPLLTVTGWKKASQIKVGDYIATPRKYNLKLKKRIPSYKVILLAHLIAAGKLDGKKIRFNHKYRDYEIERHIKFQVHKLDPHLQFEGISNRYVFAKKGKENKLTKWLNKLKLLGVEEQHKFIPDLIMMLCEPQIKLFLSHYFTCTGSVMVSDAKAYMYSGSKQVAHQLKHLFLRLGIMSTVHCRRKKGRKLRYVIEISGTEDYLKAQEFLKPLTAYKLKALERGAEIAKTQKGGLQDIIPKDIWKLTKPKEWLPVFKALNYQFKKPRLQKMDFAVTRKNMKKIAKATNNKTLELFSDSDVFWSRVTKKETKKGTFTVWDIEVDHPAHNFVANDIIVHNSYCLHSLVSRLFWKPQYDYKICILNDSSRETGTWSLPNEDPNQILTLQKLNENPLPLPCVYLHPLVKEDYEKLFMGNVGYDVTIPFKEIIDKHKDYLNLKDSSRYFTKVVNELREASSQEEAEQILDLLSLQHNIPPQTATKIRAEFDTLFDTKMTDISTEGQVPWSTSKNIKKNYNPLTAAIHAGLLPVLETEFISNQRQLLSIYFRYFVGDLFNRQKQDEDFLAEMSELLLVIDEAHNISGVGPISGADLLLRRCVREGRPRRLGTLLATQKFNELPDVIKDNTTFLVVFKNPGEASQISNQYNMGKHMADRIKDLDKHQCLVYTTEHFIVYDSNGKRRKSKLNETFVGKTLPPYSLHKRPNKKQS